MYMRGLACTRSGLVVDGTVESDEHYKNRIAPLVLLHLPDDFLADHFSAEQFEHEMARIDIRDDQLTHRNFFCSCQPYAGCTFCIAENFVDKHIRADFAAMRLQIFSKCKSDAIHPPFDKIVADVLQDRSEQPPELRA